VPFTLLSGTFGCALFLIGVSFLNCTQTALAVTLVTLASMFWGVGLSGYYVNHMDIAPPYAGTLTGVTNCVAASSGFIAPLVAAVLTTDVRRPRYYIILVYRYVFCSSSKSNWIIKYDT